MIMRSLLMMKIGERRRRLAVGAVAAVVGFAVAGGGAAVAVGALTNGDQVSIGQLPGVSDNPAPAWPANANGQTYGSLLKSTSSATDPDLVQAIATNGEAGYVYASELNPAAPSSPAAALAQQAANKTAQYIPVYEQDGTTVIGQFEVSQPLADAG
jgi:hypothetical protein